MPEYLVRIDVILRPLVNDPQGLAVRDGLHALGFADVATVRVGKHIEVRVAAADAAAAEQAVRAMCEQLLANPVIEQFSLAVTEAVPAS
ncbi:MAG: phosphoribosylformylglycinamidine synthase subunit PurS [Chloroflexi bacterium]|nr:phosphoribosylformylglycinamidine synthase subunit PurS [Chloroflexota bacterium]